MDNLLGKAQEMAAAAGIKRDEGESIEQTMKEETLEHVIKEKIEAVAGEKVANSDQVEQVIEKVADAVGDKVPASALAGIAAGSAASDDKTESNSANELLGKAMGMFGK